LLVGVVSDDFGGGYRGLELGLVLAALVGFVVSWLWFVSERHVDRDTRRAKEPDWRQRAVKLASDPRSVVLADGKAPEFNFARQCDLVLRCADRAVAACPKRKGAARGVSPASRLT
jgi:hypothetical protein